MDKESAMPVENGRTQPTDERTSVDQSYTKLEAQRDRLLREREALIRACHYLIERQGRRRKLMLAIQTFLARGRRD